MKIHAGFFSLLFLAACGGSTSTTDSPAPKTNPDPGTSPGTRTSTDNTTSTSATPHFAPLPIAERQDELLTYLAHLYGQPLGDGTAMHTVSDIAVINPANSATTVLLNAELQGYSAPGSVSFSLPAARTTVAPPLDLTLDFQALYRISAPVTASLSLSLTAPGSSAPLDVRSTTVLIYPKNTIFWAKADAQGTITDLRHTIAAFVTPHDQSRAIDQLLKEAAAYSSFGAMIGYQYMGKLEKPSSWTGNAQPGYCQVGTASLSAGSKYQVSANSTCPACDADDGYLQVYTQAEWQGTRATAKPLAQLDKLGQGTISFTAPSTEAYVVAACAPADAGGSRSYSFGVTPTLDAVTGAYDQTAAIFLALKARGTDYVSVAADFFTGAQNVKYPAESLATKSANCIDGALIFASALESMGMRPGIVIVPGHATVAVLVDPKADPCSLDSWLPMETTMVGTSEPLAAVEQDLKTVMPQVKGILAKGCSSYKPGEPVLVDIATMREIGLRPAPM